jgi:hypothetical protein
LAAGTGRRARAVQALPCADARRPVINRPDLVSRSEL